MHKNNNCYIQATKGPETRNALQKGGPKQKAIEQLTNMNGTWQQSPHYHYQGL